MFVDQLHGRYTYRLDLRDTDPSDRPALSLIYGENGSGKTTILAILFHLLNHRAGEGHKSHVAHVKFKTFRVTFANGTTVSATRPSSRVGSYQLSIKLPNHKELTAALEVDEEGAIPGQATNTDKQFRKALDELRQLNLALFFLPDSRGLLTNTIEGDSEEGPNDAFIDVAGGGRISLRGGLGRHNLRRRGTLDTALEAALEHLATWTRTRVISGSTQGYLDANLIYERIAAELTSGGQGEDSSEVILNILDKQAQRSLQFAEFGLSPPLKTSKLISTITSAKQHKRVLTQVMRPYINAVKARLDALEPTRVALEDFTRGVNAFFNGKRVSFSLDHGLVLRSDGGDLLLPHQLSSGEKQLLLLFCTTVLASDRETIFIVDEPEMSLNVRWQRQLVTNLLRLARQREVQFIFATHSIEIITGHREKVQPLSSQ